MLSQLCRALGAKPDINFTIGAFSDTGLACRHVGPCESAEPGKHPSLVLEIRTLAALSLCGIRPVLEGDAQICVQGKSSFDLCSQSKN